MHRFALSLEAFGQLDEFVPATCVVSDHHSDDSAQVHARFNEPLILEGNELIRLLNCDLLSVLDKQSPDALRIIINPLPINTAR